MNLNLSLLAGIGLGAAAMFMLDHAQGRRRRALARDRAVWATHRAQRFLGAAARDTGHRLEGAQARLRDAVAGPEPVSDETLLARVRSAIGRAVTHPGAVHVMIEDGVVRLDGAVFADQLDSLLSAVRRVDGVTAIDNRLHLSDTGEGVPGLQGEGKRRARWLRVPRSPMARLCTGAAVVGLMAYGVTAARARILARST